MALTMYDMAHTIFLGVIVILLALVVAGKITIKVKQVSNPPPVTSGMLPSYGVSHNPYYQTLLEKSLFGGDANIPQASSDEVFAYSAWNDTLYGKIAPPTDDPFAGVKLPCQMLKDGTSSCSKKTDVLIPPSIADIPPNIAGAYSPDNVVAANLPVYQLGSDDLFRPQKASGFAGSLDRTLNQALRGM